DARTMVGAERSSRELERSKVTVLGAYARQEIAWRNRVFLNGGLRVGDDRARDQGLGRRTDLSFGASVLAVDRSGDPRGGWLSRLRLRAGWGRIGRLPGDTLLLMVPVLANLRPETARELETGFDAELSSGRVIVAATWYRRQVDDGFVTRLSPPSQGLAVI